MILAIGTYDAIGGLKTVTDSYLESLGHNSPPITWILFGQSRLPIQNRPNCIPIQLKDNWKIYADQAHVELEVKNKVREIVDRYQPKLLFRPLEYAFEPYLENLNIPSVIQVLLLNGPLTDSLKRQTYFDDPSAQQGYNCDLIREKVERTCYEKNDAFIFNSETTRRDFNTYYSESRAKYFTCSPPGAQAEFRNSEELRLTKKILFFGRLTHQKGIPNIVQNIPDGWSLTVLGDGKWDLEQARRLGIKFEKWANRKRILSHLNQSTFCIFPSHYEPWGLSLNEALAAGRICIAQSGAGGHEEQIVDGVNGRLIDFNRESFWATAEELLSKDPKQIIEMSLAARQSARQWETHCKDVESFISRCYASTQTSDVRGVTA